MDILSHPLSVDELRSLWLFYSTPHPRDSVTNVINIDDLTRLLQSIREQDAMSTDLPSIEPEYVSKVMAEYLRPSTRYKDAVIVLWPEFSTNFNSYWIKRSDIYEQWRARATVKSVEGNTHTNSRLPPSKSQTFHSSLMASRTAPVSDGSARVLEAELVEVSERLRQARYQLDEERQKRHQLRDELDEVRRQMEEERVRHREQAKQLVVLEEDKLTHDIQVGRLRETVDQAVSLKETFQLDLDRARMQLFHAKQKYDVALTSIMADNESLRKKIELFELSKTDEQKSSTMKELETQNNILRNRNSRNSAFPDSMDSASSAAFSSPKLGKETEFLNALMEALDRAKFLNKQMNDASTDQTWQDLCVNWRETVCELCDLFATAHRIQTN